MIETICVSGDIIDQVASGNSRLTCSDLNLPNEPHAGYIFLNGKQSLLVKATPELTFTKISTNKSIGKLKARSAEQHFYFNYLLDPQIDLVVAVGRAGTGKTLLAMAAAIDNVIEGNGPQKRIFLTKSLSENGKYRMGPVPGDMREKISPYIANYLGALSKILGYDGVDHLDRLEMNEQLTFFPLNYLKGMSIDDSIIIIDEAQDLSNLELRQIGTRVGENSRLFVLGDTHQSSDHRSEGLLTLSRSRDVLESSFCASIELVKNERSRLSLLLDNVLA